MKKSQNTLISMLEELFSEKDTAEKKQILADEYGMIMTAELEGRIKIMCNLSEAIEDRGFRKGYTEGISKGVSKERIDTIKRMIKANITREQIASMGYTKAEYKKAKNALGTGDCTPS